MSGCGRPRAVFLLFACLYALSIGRGFYGSDGEVMFQTTAALVERGTFALPPDPGLPQIVAGAGERYYGKYDPGLPVLAAPFYVTGDRIAAINHAHRHRLAAVWVLLLPALAAAGAAAGAAGLAQRVDGPQARPYTNVLLVILAAGLATPLWVYGRELYAEAVLACALTAAVGCVVHARAGHRPAPTGWLILGGAAFGVGILTRAACAIYALPLAVLIGWPDREFPVRRLIAFGAGALPFVAILLICNAARFGRPLRFGYAGEGFTTPPWEGIAGLLVGPGRSVFLYAPPLALSAILWPRFRRADPAAAWFLAWAWGAALVFYGTWWAWHGGWSWGPRFLLPLLPLSCLPLRELPAGRGWRAAAVLLIAAGTGVQVAGVLTNVTPHFAAVFAAHADPYTAVNFVPAHSPLVGAIRRLAQGHTEPLALFHLADTGLPITWSVGAPLALIAGLAVGAGGLIWPRRQ